VFVNAPDDTDEAAFNRKLFMARRRAEKAREVADPAFYVPSLSAVTLVYKGMVMPQHLVEFYPDLADERVEASVASSTSASRPTRCRSGGWRIRSASSRTTARSTPSRATATGRWRAARWRSRRCCPTWREVRRCVDARLGFAEPRQHARGAADGRHGSAARDAHADAAGLAVARHTWTPDLRAFYEFYAMHMEPWDGPAGIVLTDGRYAACTLDRNGLRPARWVHRRPHLTIASEVGVWDYKPEHVVAKGKLGPGEMIAVDLHARRAARHATTSTTLKRAPSVQAVAQAGRALPEPT
jgi:glutamate synthase (NADPH/NADH) large chain